MEELYLKEKFKNIDKTLDDHEIRIDTSEKTINKLDKDNSVFIAKISAAIEHLSTLPEVIEGLRQTNEGMKESLLVLNGKVDSLDGKVCDLKERVDEADKNMNFNFVQWVKDHFVGVLLAVGGLIALYFGVTK